MFVDNGDKKLIEQKTIIKLDIHGLMVGRVK